MMDKYTKGVLTVIAVALVTISFQLSQTNIMNTASAHPTKQLTSTCVKSSKISANHVHARDVYIQGQSGDEYAISLQDYIEKYFLVQQPVENESSLIWTYCDE